MGSGSYILSRNGKYIYPSRVMSDVPLIAARLIPSRSPNCRLSETLVGK